MSDPTDPTDPTDRSENEAGWAAPDLPPRAPAPGVPPAPEPSPPSWPAPGVPPIPPAAPAPYSTPYAATPAPSTGGAGGRSRHAWIVVLGVALGAIVLIAVVGTMLFVTRSLPPYSAAHDFLRDVTHADASAAAARLCAADREDPESAFGIVTGHFVASGTITVDPLSVDRDGDRATVKYTIKSGTDHTYKLALRQEHGTWKACPGDKPR